MSVARFLASLSLRARIIGFRTSGTLDGDDSGADVDLHIVWDDQLLLGEDVLHLEQWYG